MSMIREADKHLFTVNHAYWILSLIFLDWCYYYRRKEEENKKKHNAIQYHIMLHMLHNVLFSIVRANGTIAVKLRLRYLKLSVH